MKQPVRQIGGEIPPFFRPLVGVPGQPEETSPLDQRVGDLERQMPGADFRIGVGLGRKSDLDTLIVGRKGDFLPIAGGVLLAVPVPDAGSVRKGPRFGLRVDPVGDIVEHQTKVRQRLVPAVKRPLPGVFAQVEQQFPAEEGNKAEDQRPGKGDRRKRPGRGAGEGNFSVHHLVRHC